MTPTLSRADSSGALDSVGEFFGKRGLDLLLNLSVLGLLWFAYGAVRGVTADQFAVAVNNASDVLRFQSAVGLPSELAIQDGLLDHTMLLKAANVYYIALHFPVTILFLGWVWFSHREHFARVRNTLIGVTAVGLIVHLIYPLAPPRMLSAFVDTAARLGPNPYEMEISSSANQIAAMPSLHVGWALIVALGVVRILDSKWRFLAFLHPVLTALVVVVTANHYWTDGIVATSLVLIGWVVFRNSGTDGSGSERPASQGAELLDSSFSTPAAL